eukprot:8843584-Pyramimonas_sp.AAC.2
MRGRGARTRVSVCRMLVRKLWKVRLRIIAKEPSNNRTLRLRRGTRRGPTLERDQEVSTRTASTPSGRRSADMRWGGNVDTGASGKCSCTAAWIKEDFPVLQVPATAITTPSSYRVIFRLTHRTEML